MTPDENPMVRMKRMERVFMMDDVLEVLNKVYIWLDFHMINI